jgi:hypothetical protein
MSYGPEADEVRAWQQVGAWLRVLREYRGWTLVNVAGRRNSAGRPLIGDTRLRQIEVGYHPVKADGQTGLPQPRTMRGIELALWIRPGRIDQLLSKARRGLDLPDVRYEPVIQPVEADELEHQRPAHRPGPSRRAHPAHLPHPAPVSDPTEVAFLSA